MPSVSRKQHNLMAMVANDPSAAKRVGIPQSVGQDFMKADKGLKFGKGTRTRADLQKINKPETRHGKSELFSEGGRMAESKSMMKKEVSFMKKKGAPKSMIKHEMKEAGMEAGGIAKKMPTARQMGNLGMKHGGAVKKMAGGGLAAGHKAADGVAKKGKTVGKMVAMKYGGKC